MNQLQRLVITTAFSGLVLSGHSSAAEVSVTPTNRAKADYGRIQLDICSLPVPETKATYRFDQDSQHCENNRSSQFTLENVPSATIIHFYTSDICSDAHSKDEAFVKLKTTKQPTTWKENEYLSFDALKSTNPGYLFPGKNLRVDDMWDGMAGKAWNEKISCVYIERSQPVK